MKPTINIAMIAFGGIAKTHLLGVYMANLKFNLPFQLRVSHIITSRPEAVPYQDIKVCKTIEEALLDCEHIDMIDICNINQAHLQTIEKAVKAHKPIYCEKPLAESLSKAKQAVDSVHQANLANGVPLIFRYLPCVHLLKKTLQEDSLGEVIRFQGVFYHSSYLTEAKRDTWRTREHAGGGTSLDLGVHMLDIVRFIFGEAKSACSEKEIHFSNVKVDEISHTTLVMQSGIIGHVHTSRVYAQKKQSVYLEVFCERGSYLCDFTNPYDLEVNTFGKGTEYRKATPSDAFMKHIVSEEGATQYHLDAHMAAITDFAYRIFNQKDSAFGADFEEAYRSQSLLESDEGTGAAI